MADKLSNRLAKADDLTNNLANNLTNYTQAIDLINRQKAEIERLKQTPKCVYAYDGKTVEYCVEGPCSVEKTIDEIKSEAIREFAERLKNKSELLAPSVYAELFRAVSVEEIDNLVAEMTEDNDAE